MTDAGLFAPLWRELAEKKALAADYANGAYSNAAERGSAEEVFAMGWDNHGSEVADSAEKVADKILAKWVVCEYEEDIRPLRRDFIAGYVARQAYVERIKRTEAAGEKVDEPRPF